MFFDDAAILKGHLKTREGNDSSAQVEMSVEEWRRSEVLHHVHIAINKTTAPGRESGAIIVLVAILNDNLRRGEKQSWTAPFRS